jgi:hypothetical protein
LIKAIIINNKILTEGDKVVIKDLDNIVRTVVIDNSNKDPKITASFSLLLSQCFKMNCKKNVCKNSIKIIKCKYKIKDDIYKGLI